MQIVSPLVLKRQPSRNSKSRKKWSLQHKHELSGPSLQAIINLRFIFIGEVQSRLALTKQNQMLGRGFASMKGISLNFCIEACHILTNISLNMSE